MAGRRLSILALVFFYVTYNVEAYNFTHHVTLDDKNEYKMWWMLGDDDTITVKVTVKTIGWIGWGISPNGKMEGADMVIGWIDKDGKTFFTDRNGRGHFEPIIDDEQNYDLHEMSEENGETTIIFSRKMQLCGEQDNEITADTMRVLYAWNDADPVENKYVLKHTKKGSRSLYLLDYGDRARQPLPTSYQSYDLVMTNLTVPDDHTSYMCNSFKLPNMTGKHHLIRVDIIITPGNENYVHHMLLYECEHVLDKDLDVQHQCFSRNMPDLNCDRETVIHAWAIGGSTYFYPKEVGLPLNVPGAPKYFLLEIHYDNQEERNDIVDSSGLRFIYTDELRPIDAGILQIGLEIDKKAQIIPQRQTSFTSYAYCGSECLNITNEKVYLFSAALHSHTAGRKMVFRLIRDSDNTEVMKIEDKTYDFNFQELKHFKEPIEIPAGHSIDVECTYSTLDRPDPTTAGESTLQEMCLVYLFVYPKLNLRTCYSATTATRTFGKKELNLTLEPESGYITSSYITGGKEFKYERLDKAMREREFWTEHIGKPLVKQFERAGAEYPYQKICKYADRDEDVEGIVDVQPRIYLKDKKCEQAKKSGNNGNNGNNACINSVSKLLLFIVVLCSWRMCR